MKKRTATIPLIALSLVAVKNYNYDIVQLNYIVSVHNYGERFPLISFLFVDYKLIPGRFPASISTALRSPLVPAVRPHCGEGYHGGSSGNAVHGQACEAWPFLKNNRLTLEKEAG
jgi:hypothetical protein